MKKVNARGNGPRRKWTRERKTWANTAGNDQERVDGSWKRRQTRSKARSQ